MFTGRDRTRPHETDDSATNGEAPSRRHGERHTVPPLRACIRNRWDESGRLKAASARSISYRNAATRSRVRAFQNQTIDFAPQFLGRCFKHQPPRVKNDIPVRADFRQAHAQSLTNPALGAVAFHCASKGAGHRESQARSGFAAFHPQAKRGKVRPGNADAVVIDFSKIGGTENSGGFRKEKPILRTGRLSRH